MIWGAGNVRAIDANASLVVQVSAVDCDRLAKHRGLRWFNFLDEGETVVLVPAGRHLTYPVEVEPRVDALARTDGDGELLRPVV